jgi:hypothetical protein
LLCAFSLSLSVSLISSWQIPFLARNLERCTPADWRHTTEAEDFLLDHFSEDEARTEENQKKAAENFSLSRYLWNGNTIINQPRRKRKSNTTAKERSLLQGQLSNPFLISYAKKAQKRLMMFKPEKQRLVMIKPFDNEA